MNIFNTKRLLSLVLVLAICFSLTACADTAKSLLDNVIGGEEETTEDAVDTTDYTYAKSGGSIVMHEGLVASEGSNVLNTMLEGDTMAGILTLVSYRTTGYFTTAGSITVNIKGEITFSNGEKIDGGTKYTDTTLTLWKQGDGYTEFVETVHFDADGTTKTHTFNNLDIGAQYRIGITYGTVAKYRVSGTFNIIGIAAEGSAEETVAQE